MKISALAFSLFVAVFTASAQGVDIYVSDTGNFNLPPWQILKYDENGENPEVFTNTGLAWPQDIVFLEEANTMLVSNLNSGRITKYDATTGAYTGDFATGIGGPTRMKIGADQLLYVLQWQGNGTVRRYQLDGTYMGEFTNVGVTQSIGLDWDSSGNLYVSSFNGKIVRKFDSNGTDQGAFINSNLAGPTNIWFQANGDLMVVDYSGGAVKRFDANGNFISNFIQGLSQAEGVDFLSNGNLLLGNGGTAAVKLFDTNGVFIKDIVASGSGGLIRPNAVVVRNKAPDFQINAGIDDAWVSSGAPFQGMFFTFFPDLNVLFAAWFTFDSVIPTGESMATFGAIDQRWVTGLGAVNGNQANLNMELTTGGAFNFPTPVPVQDTNYGTLNLEFASCSEATVSYNFPANGLAGEFIMNRVVDDNVSLCEMLAEG